MGRAARNNPLSRQAHGGTVIRPVTMPRTKQRVSPARMSPEGLDAWLKARLTRDVVLTPALIDTFVTKSRPGLRLAVRGFLETLLAEQHRKRREADARTETFIARQTQFRGGVDDEAEEAAAASPVAIPEAPSTYALMQEGLRQDAERGVLLTAVERLAQDHRRSDE